MKNLGVSIALITLHLFLTSCGVKENSGDETVVEFWHFWSEPGQKKALTPLLLQFEKEHNCTVRTSELSWNDGKTKLLAAFNSRTAPDVLELGSDWIAQFSSAGALLEQNPDSAARFVDFSLPSAKWNNKIYALPWVVDSRVMFLNSDLLEKYGQTTTPPTSIEELIAITSAMKDMSSDVYAFGANGADPHRLYKKILPLIWSAGGDVLNDSGQPTLNSEFCVRALDAYVRLARNGFIETQRQIDESFVQGKVAFCFSGSWMMAKIAAGNPSLRYRPVLVPGINGSSVSFAGGEYLAVNASAKNKELSQKLVEFLTNGKHALAFCKTVPEAGFPADKAAMSDDYFSSNPYKKVFAEQLKSSRMTPVHPKWLEIESELEDAVVSALLGEKSSRDALNLAQEKVLALINSKR